MTWITRLDLRQRILIVLIAVDHLALAIATLGYCKRGQTISAAAWALEQNGKFMGRTFSPAIDWLFTCIERDHCQVSYESEKHMYSRNERTEP